MPELPEVETTRRGVEPELVGRSVSHVILRNPALRHPVPQELPDLLAERHLGAIDRRAKYLLFRFEHGTLVVHLGMSGSLRIVGPDTVPGKHDHLDIAFGARILRYRDPRRFGLVIWHNGPDDTHPLLANLGLEPNDPAFDGDWLFCRIRTRTSPIKQVIMNGRLLVGVGNIYANESLFRAGILPQAQARELSLQRCIRLTNKIQQTLQDALAAGGSTLRDFVQSNGQPGYFQQQYFVYDRDGDACRICGNSILSTRIGGRSTYFCPKCQH